MLILFLGFNISRYIRAKSHNMGKRKNQYEIDEAVNLFLQEAGIRDEYLIQRMIQNWEDVVGNPIAAQTDSIEFHQGILKLKMKNAVWFQEVFMLRSQLLEKINDFIGEGIVKEIQVSAT
jgi:predicted nucleic acid-binding Zn ribbon protein